MVFPVVGGTQSTGYDISNSMMTDADSSTFLSKTLSSPNTDKFTVSYWWKGCFTGRNNQGFALGKTLTGEAGDYTQFTFRTLTMVWLTTMYLILTLLQRVQF